MSELIPIKPKYIKQYLSTASYSETSDHKYTLAKALKWSNVMDVSTLVEAMAKYKLSTHLKYFRYIRPFLDWLSDYYPEYEVHFAKYIKDVKRLKRTGAYRNCEKKVEARITYAEFLDELEAATGEKERVLILTGFAGLRRCELFSFDGECAMGKGKKPFKVVLPDKYKWVLGKPFNKQSLTATLKTLKGNPHSYRKVYTDYLQQLGLTPFEIQKAMRHSSFTTTQRYIRSVNQDELEIKLRSGL